jgi:carnitine O-acetyltransferase
MIRLARNAKFAFNTRLVKMPAAIRNNSTAGTVKEDPSKGPMLRFQESLPRLPVPSLEETATKYLRSVKAVSSEQEYAKTEAAVKEFIRPGSAGHKLQERLLARANDPQTKNWLTEWWNDLAYLSYRDPVVPYVSYFYSYKDDKLRKNPATRAAFITTGVLEFKRQVDTKTIEPDMMKATPLCMDLFRYMFNVSRIPKSGTDEPEIYSAAENEYFIVLRKNRFFKVPIKGSTGSNLTTAELETQFNKIYKATEGSKRGPAIGALTSENRDVWAEARQLLLKDSKNAKSLETIEKAAFVVCLDDSAPVTNEERAHQYWHGDGQNRFFDKPLQFIICDNGSAGFIGEHSMMDGTQTHRLNDYVNDVILHNKIEFNTSTNNRQLDPEELNFEVNSTIQKAIDQAIVDFSKVIGLHELSVFAYQGYGKGLIKKFKMSPDAYVQLLLQLAYYKYQGVNRPTYESATTRRFYGGRTETTRSVSLESVNFCRTMEDNNASFEDKINAGRDAANAHVKYIADASVGKGVDRHLLGLKLSLQKGEEVPQIFKDPMFSYSSSWFLSTSQLSSEYFNGYGWSQVIDKGFGLAYMINENSIQINIVSKKLGTEKMKYYLTEAADDMAAVFGSELHKAKL